MPLASRYHPGQRRDWIKIKNVRHQEVIICGWQPGWGSRASTIGSLILGVYDDGQLGYAGNVGTGFTEAMLRRPAAAADPAAPRDEPLRHGGAARYARGAHWVEPRLVGEGGVHRMDRRWEHAPPELAGSRRRNPADVHREA